MHLQRANIPLQGLDRCALTMGAISGPHCQIGALLWHHFTIVVNLHGRQKHSGKAAQSGVEEGSQVRGAN